VSDQGNFDQRPDETAEAWLARLRAISQEGMVMHQRFSYLHRKEGAERLVKQGPKAPEPAAAVAEEAVPGVLESVKAAYQRLTRQERQQFAAWLAQGMPKD